MTGGVPIVRVFGIEVRVSLVWALLIAFVALMGTEQATQAAPGLGAAVHWLIGLAAAIAFLVTVVAHELAHALVARRQGIPRTGVVLGIMSGLAPLAVEGRRPRDELLIALAGPAVSMGVGLGAVGLAVAMAAAGPGLAVVSGSLLLVGALNLILGIISLLPGAPLDGGRAVRAIAWARTGDPDRAARVTVRVGRMLGWGLVGSGVILALSDAVTAGMLALGMGWVLATGAASLAGRTDVEGRLRGTVVADATRADVARIPPGVTVDTFADRFAGGEGVSCLPVVDGERTLGVIGVRQVRALGRSRLTTTRAADIMLAPPAAPFLASDGELWPAIELMNGLRVDGLAVVDDGRLAGVVMKESIGQLLRQRRAEAEGAAPNGTPPAGVEPGDAPPDAPPAGVEPGDAPPDDAAPTPGRSAR